MEDTGHAEWVGRHRAAINRDFRRESLLAERRRGRPVSEPPAVCLHFVDMETGEVLEPSVMRAFVRAKGTGVANPHTGEGFMPPITWLGWRGLSGALATLAVHRKTVAAWMEDCRGFFGEPSIPSPDEVIARAKAGVPNYHYTPGKGKED